jgi:hypothetical protein
VTVKQNNGNKEQRKEKNETETERKMGSETEGVE